ncbi:MAG: helix-hairpin-helix domain-containing protein [Acidobacteriota bacterium]
MSRMGNAAALHEVQLKDLRGIGKRMLEDFALLGVKSVRQLKSEDAQELYDRMCQLTATRQDPCVLDTYRCAIEQARNPDLPEEQKDWWYWSRVRKAKQ